MKNYLLLSFLIFHLSSGFAQFEEKLSGGTIFDAGQIQTINEETVKDFASQQLPNLQGENSTLQITDFRKSLYSYHYSFEQVFNGIPVYGSQVKVNVSYEGKILSIFDNSYSTYNWDYMDVKRMAGKINGDILIQPIIKNPSAETALRTVIYFLKSENVPVVVIEAKVYDPSDISYKEYLLSGNGNILLEKNLAVNFMPQDSTVTAYVFNPDPLTTAQQQYGGIYQDFNDADISALNNERQPVQMKVWFNNGVFHLTNDVVKIVNIVDKAGESHSPVDTSVPVFNFLRGNPNFEEVNAYYHIWFFNTYINNELGFGDLATFQLQVDARGKDEDNSYFVSTDTPRIMFGTGGVDDAEDADVIIHEYAHAISYSAAPGSNSGFERQAIDEGFGDYLAASYSRRLAPYRWEDIFTWDGHNEYFSGRKANKFLVYPDDLHNTDIYANGEMWSSALMEIWGELGHELTDQIVIQSLYSYAQNLEMQEAGQLLLQAENQITGGVHYNTIFSILLNRGLVPEIENSIVGSLPFIQGQGKIGVYLSNAARGAIISVYNPLGQLIGQVSNVQERVFFLPEEWFTSSGVYIVEAQTLGQRFSGKVVHIAH